MKCIKLLSSVILMSFSFVSFGQIDTLGKNQIIKPVHIRIGSPSNENNQPLYILDGEPINNKEFQKINPETIESITVLKDTAAKAIYSTRGTNGVIIIKTKKNLEKRIQKK